MASDSFGRILPFPVRRRGLVCFTRPELNRILGVYGFKVASGEWRDYAIDVLEDRAIFSVYRRSGDIALFRIEKNPSLSRRQGAFSVTDAGGRLLKRSRELRDVLRVFRSKPKLVKGMQSQGASPL